VFEHIYADSFVLARVAKVGLLEVLTILKVLSQKRFEPPCLLNITLNGEINVHLEILPLDLPLKCICTSSSFNLTIQLDHIVQFNRIPMRLVSNRYLVLHIVE